MARNVDDSNSKVFVQLVEQITPVVCVHSNAMHQQHVRTRATAITLDTGSDARSRQGYQRRARGLQDPESDHRFDDADARHWHPPVQ